MSMHSWTATGYGIDEQELCPSVDSQIAFLKKYLPVQYGEMQEEGKDCENYDMSNTSDYLDFCRSWIEDYENEQGYTGFGVLFAMAIRENEDGFDPVYVYNDGCGAIIYEDGMPWEMSDRVRNMKADDMAAIFQKYLNELGVSAAIGRQSVEMYG